MTTPGDVTQLLAAVRDGESSAMDQLFPYLYRELAEQDAGS